MPAIPVYQQQTSASQGLPTARADAGAFGAATAQAVGNVGRAGEQYVQSEAAAAARQADADARKVRAEYEDQQRVWAGQAGTDWHLRQQQSLQDAITSAQEAVSKGQPVPDITGKFLADYREKSEAVVQMAPTPEAKRWLTQNMNATMQSLGAHSIGAQATLTREWKLSTHEGTVTNAAKIVQFDPGSFTQQLNAALQTMPTIDPQTDAAKKVDLRYRLSNAAAASVLSRDPYMMRDAARVAMGEAEGNVPSWLAAMTPEQVTHWRQQADVKIHQLEAGKARDQDASAKLAVDAVQKLRTFVTEGRAPDMGYQGEVKMLTRGTPWEAEAEQLIAAGIKGAGFGSQTLPRQAALLQDLEGKPTDPETAKQVQYARSVYETQSAAYSADPWAAGSRFQRLPEIPAVAMSTPAHLAQALQQRLPLMAQFEAASGKPMPLLRPAEVPQAVRMLQGMPIHDRTEALGQIGQALGNDERLGAFAAQLDAANRPLALTLRMGTDRTTAGRMASELVQVGAQALADKTVKKDDTALAGWRAEIATLVRGTVGDPKAEDSIIDAAYYIRAAQELDGSAAPGFKSGSGASKAVAMAIGAPLERGGVKTLLPRGMSEADFDTKARASLAPMAGQTMYVRGQPVPAESVANRWDSYGLRLVRPGVYAPVTNNAPVTLDKEGQQPLLIKVQ